MDGTVSSTEGREPRLGSREPARGLPWGPWSTTVVAIAAILAIFHETAGSILQTWMTSDLFGHGFLILPIVGWLIWKRRERIAGVVPRPAWVTGLTAMAALAFLWLLGDIASVNLVRQFAFVAMVPAIVLTTLGRDMLKAMVFPLGYLFFAVPFGAFLIAPLQDITAVFSVRALQLTGIPVFIDGIFLQIPTGNFLVAEACSGARFLISTLAIGVLVADLFFRSWARRLLFMVLAVCVPIITNGFRAYGIVIVAHYIDPGFAASADHVTFGLVFMSLVTVLLLMLGMSFRERSMQDYDEEVSAPLKGMDERGAPQISQFAVAGLAVVAVAVAAPAYASFITAVPGGGAGVALRAPDVAPPWSQVSEETTMWAPKYSGVDGKAMGSYRSPDKSVEYFIGYFASQRPGAELVNETNNVNDGAWGRAGSGRMTVEIDGQTVEANYVRLLPARHEGNRTEVAGRVTVYWYWVGGKFTADPIMAKLLEVKSTLLGEDRSAAVIVFAADYAEAPSEARETLREFLRHVEPLEAYLEKTGAQVARPASS